MKRLLLLPVVMLGLFSCADFDTQKKTKKEKYKMSAEELAKVEKDDPVQFLNVAINDKKNLIGQTVVKGTVRNDAKVAVYKDVEVKLTFYSKTKTVLEQDIETVYDSILPGRSVTFKSKFFPPKGCDSVGAQVMGAK